MNFTRHKIFPFILAYSCSCLVVLVTCGYLMSENNSIGRTNWVVVGFSSQTVLFVTSCMAATQTILLLSCTLLGDSGADLVKTTYFQANQIVFAVLYLCSSIAYLFLYDKRHYCPIDWAEGLLATGGLSGIFSALFHFTAFVIAKVV